MGKETESRVSKSAFSDLHLIPFRQYMLLNTYALVRWIYPRTAIANHGNLGLRNSVTNLHHYVYTDEDNCFDLIVEGGAWVQFLPETSLLCHLDSGVIHGRSPDETRFYSEGLPTRGMKVAATVS